MTYPEMIAGRIVKQAAAAHIPPTRLLLEEMLDMQRAYMVALEILVKESTNDNRNSQRVPD